MSTPDEPSAEEVEAAIAARRVELAEEYEKRPPFDYEADRERRLESMRPMSSKHWMVKRWHRQFMRAGWRRLIAKQAAKIIELEQKLDECCKFPIVEIPAAKLTPEGLAEFREQWDAQMAGIRGDPVFSTGPTPGKPPRQEPVVNEKVCVTCSGALGNKYYQDVPNIGDQCLACHEVMFPLGAGYTP